LKTQAFYNKVYRKTEEIVEELRKTEPIVFKSL